VNKRETHELHTQQHVQLLCTTYGSYSHVGTMGFFRQDTYGAGTGSGAGDGGAGGSGGGEGGEGLGGRGLGGDGDGGLGALTHVSMARTSSLHLLGRTSHHSDPFFTRMVFIVSTAAAQSLLHLPPESQVHVRLRLNVPAWGERRAQRWDS
jgi:hypothetical protein